MSKSFVKGPNFVLFGKLGDKGVSLRIQTVLAIDTKMEVTPQVALSAAHVLPLMLERGQAMR